MAHIGGNRRDSVTAQRGEIYQETGDASNQVEIFETTPTYIVVEYNDGRRFQVSNGEFKERFERPDSL